MKKEIKKKPVMVLLTAYISGKKVVIEAESLKKAQEKLSKLTKSKK